MYILLRDYHIKPYEIDLIPNEYLEDIFNIREFENERESRDNRKGSRTLQAENNVRRKAGFI